MKQYNLYVVPRGKEMRLELEKYGVVVEGTSPYYEVLQSLVLDAYRRITDLENHVEILKGDK